MEVLQVQSELDEMVAIYAARQPKRVLEIGTWDGGTLREWLTGGAPEVVVAVDLEHRQPEAYEEWRSPGTQLFVITGSSLEDSTRDAIRVLGPFDWVLIDGDHEDDGVRGDWEFVSTVLAAGAVVCFHDITPPDFMQDYPPGVLVDELEAAGYHVERFQDLEPQPWARGIGVVFT